jgi:hypothetical protein
MNKEVERVVLNIDNKSAISLCKNLVHHDMSKHIDTKYHYIWQCVEESKIKANYIYTHDQLAYFDQIFESAEILGDARKNKRSSCKNEHIMLKQAIVSNDNQHRYGVVCVCACVLNQCRIWVASCNAVLEARSFARRLCLLWFA